MRVRSAFWFQRDCTTRRLNFSRRFHVRIFNWSYIGRLFARFNFPTILSRNLQYRIRYFCIFRDSHLYMLDLGFHCPLATGLSRDSTNGVLILSSQYVRLVRKACSPAAMYCRAFESKWRSLVSTRQFLVFPRIIYYRTRGVKGIIIRVRCSTSFLSVWIIKYSWKRVATLGCKFFRDYRF